MAIFHPGLLQGASCHQCKWHSTAIPYPSALLLIAWQCNMQCGTSSTVSAMPSHPPPAGPGGLLQEGLFLDVHTQRLLVQVVTYNSQLRLFSSAIVSFDFSKGGSVQVTKLAWHPAAGLMP